MKTYEVRVSYATYIDLVVKCETENEALEKVRTNEVLHGDLLSEKNFEEQVMENLQISVDLTEVGQ